MILLFSFNNFFTLLIKETSQIFLYSYFFLYSYQTLCYNEALSWVFRKTAGSNPALYKMPARAVDAIETYENGKASSINNIADGKTIHDVYMREDLGHLNFDELLDIG